MGDVLKGITCSLPDHKITMTGGAGASKMLFGADRQHFVQTADKEIHPLPVGTRMIVAARRQCGDWYAEIEGKKHVAGIGQTADDAFLAALAKAA